VFGLVVVIDLALAAGAAGAVTGEEHEVDDARKNPTKQQEDADNRASSGDLLARADITAVGVRADNLAATRLTSNGRWQRDGYSQIGGIEHGVRPYLWEGVTKYAGKMLI